MAVHNPDVVIIGAGMSGLICAQVLQHAGLNVAIFEKSRGVGGRMATRRTDTEILTDHGAQYFTVTEPAFQTVFDHWLKSGIVDQWRAPIVELKHGEVVADKSDATRYVGVPTMNAVCRSLADELTIHLGSQISGLEQVADSWVLYDDHEKAVARSETVICTAPAPQTAALLNSIPSIAVPARDVEMEACWTLVLILNVGMNLPYGGAFINDSELAWIACNSSKPGRQRSPEVWVLHASAEWSRQHLDESPDTIERELLTVFQRETGHWPAAISRSWTHRWRYAKPTNPLKTRCLFDEQLRIGACGDWCGGPRVEGAFQSGLALANKIVNS